MLQIVQPVAQIDPKIIDHLDGDGLIKHLLKSLSIPASVTRSDSQVRSIRAKKEEEKVVQQEQQQQLIDSEVAKNSAPALEALNSIPEEEI